MQKFHRSFIRLFSLSLFLTALFDQNLGFGAPTPEQVIHSDLAQATTNQDPAKLISNWRNFPKDRALRALFQEAKVPLLPPEKRYLATHCLGLIGQSHALSYLKNLLTSPQWLVRHAALNSLEKLITTTELKTISLALAQSDPSLLIRSQALRVYARLLDVQKQETPITEAYALLQIAYSNRHYRPGNFEKGVADEIVFRSLEVLRHARLRPQDAKKISYHMVPMLNKSFQKKLRIHALHTMETLYGLKAQNQSLTLESRISKLNIMARQEVLPLRQTHSAPTVLLQKKAEARSPVASPLF